MKSSKSSGSYAHVGERMGSNGATSPQVGGMVPGKSASGLPKKMAAGKYFETGRAGGKLNMQNPRDED